jgi:hypothetical protein
MSWRVQKLFALVTLAGALAINVMPVSEKADSAWTEVRQAA